MVGVPFGLISEAQFASALRADTPKVSIAP